MTRNAGTLLIVSMVLVSSAAWAGPLAMALGETTFLSFPARSSKVELSDASVVAVRTSSSGVELRAMHPGVSRVTLRLRGGQTHEFTVHVTPKGAQVYSTNRAEPEHPDFSLTPAPTPAKSQAPRTAQKPAKAASPRA